MGRDMGAATTKRKTPFSPLGHTTLAPSSLHVCVRNDYALVLVTLREKKTGCQQSSLYFSVKT